MLVDRMIALDRVEAEANRGDQAAGLLDGIMIGLLDARAARITQPSPPDGEAEASRPTRL